MPVFLAFDQDDIPPVLARGIEPGDRARRSAAKPLVERILGVARIVIGKIHLRDHSVALAPDVEVDMRGALADRRVIAGGLDRGDPPFACGTCRNRGVALKVRIERLRGRIAGMRITTKCIALPDFQL